MWAADRIVAPTPGPAIIIPATANEIAIKGNHLTLLKGNQFDGRNKTNPHKHIHEFIGVCDMFKYRATVTEAVRLMMFPLLLTCEAKTWLDKLDEGTIESWDELRTAFISRFSSQLYSTDFSEKFEDFSQHERETLTDAWLRMRELLRNCHGHGLTKGNIIKIFCHGLDETTQEALDATSGAFTNEGSSNYDTDKIMARMDAMAIKMDDSHAPIDLNSDDEDEEPPPQPQTPKTNKEAPVPNSYKPRISYPQRLRKEKIEAQSGKFLDMIHVVRINVPLVYVLARMSNYGKFLKELVSNKHNIDVIDEILEEDFDALLDEGSKIFYSIQGNPLEDKLFAEFNEFIAINIEENIKSKINEEELTFEQITFDSDYKIKISLEEPPTDLELKPLPSHLEYAFLEGTSFLPLIISSQLSEQNKNKLIALLDDKKPVVQKQRRLNPNMKEVVKKEIIKLLDTGKIYPIADSPWVSLIHCVPKKGGITVVTNEKDELVPTRIVTGWRVCIHCRKLNDATAKDHFLFSFMDQMLERLAGNKYFVSSTVFLDISKYRSILWIKKKQPSPALSEHTLIGECLLAFSVHLLPSRGAC
ncbi:reverse transcriptase domain-containing protein [Tanacetum coccineum]